MDGVGREIKRLREEKGWTGAQLAVYADMSPSAVSQIETGRRSPNAASMRKLADALEVEVADLFPKAQAPLPLELLGQTSQLDEQSGLGMLESALVYEELLREAFRRDEAGESRDFVVRELAALLEKGLRTAGEGTAALGGQLGISPRRWEEGLQQEIAERINDGEDRAVLVREYGQVFEEILGEMLREVLSDESTKRSAERPAMLWIDA